jgi:hypothetical protein
VSEEISVIEKTADTGEAYGVIVISRVAESRADKWRAYRVMVDGHNVGKLRAGERIRYRAAVGSHSVWVAIDWCRSERHHVELASAGLLALRCTGPKSAVDAAINSIFHPRAYLSLERV